MNQAMSQEDKELSEKLIERLKTFDEDRWIDIAHTFNGWVFPTGFYDLVPNWWRMGTREHLVLRPLMQMVTDKFGNKEQLRFHNVSMGNMSNEEFEYWYSIRDNPDDKIYTDYCNKRHAIEKLHWWKDEIFEKLKPVLFYSEHKP